MPLFQFPWRMMGPLAFVASIAVGLSAQFVLNGKTNKSLVRTESILFLMCILNAVPVLIACRPLSESETAQLPFILKGDAIRQKGLQATVLDEYLPRHANKEENNSSDADIPVKSFSNITIKIIENTGTAIVIDTIGETSAKLRFNRWFFPEWRCLVNGLPKNIDINSAGTFDVMIPSGSNHIEISLLPPFVRRIGLWISFCSLVVWMMAAFWLFIHSCCAKKCAAK